MAILPAYHNGQYSHHKDNYNVSTQENDNKYPMWVNKFIGLVEGVGEASMIVAATIGKFLPVLAIVALLGLANGSIWATALSLIMAELAAVFFHKEYRTTPLSRTGLFFYYTAFVLAGINIFIGATIYISVGLTEETLSILHSIPTYTSGLAFVIYGIMDKTTIENITKLSLERAKIETESIKTDIAQNELLNMRQLATIDQERQQGEADIQRQNMLEEMKQRANFSSQLRASDRTTYSEMINESIFLNMRKQAIMRGLLQQELIANGQNPNHKKNTEFINQTLTKIAPQAQDSPLLIDSHGADFLAARRNISGD